MCFGQSLRLIIGIRLLCVLVRLCILYFLIDCIYIVNCRRILLRIGEIVFCCFNIRSCRRVCICSGLPVLFCIRFCRLSCVLFVLCSFHCRCCLLRVLCRVGQEIFCNIYDVARVIVRFCSRICCLLCLINLSVSHNGHGVSCFFAGSDLPAEVRLLTLIVRKGFLCILRFISSLFCCPGCFIRGGLCRILVIRNGLLSGILCRLCVLRCCVKCALRIAIRILRVIMHLLCVIPVCRSLVYCRLRLVHFILCRINCGLLRIICRCFCCVNACPVRCRECGSDACCCHNHCLFAELSHDLILRFMIANE